MADANNCDFSLFKRWYSQSGTPNIKVTLKYNADSQIYSLTLEQDILPIADQQVKQLLHIPVKMSFITPAGELLSKSKNKLIFLIISQQNQWLLYLYLGIFLHQ